MSQAMPSHVSFYKEFCGRPQYEDLEVTIIASQRDISDYFTG